MLTFYQKLYARYKDHTCEESQQVNKKKIECRQ